MDIENLSMVEKNVISRNNENKNFAKFKVNSRYCKETRNIPNKGSNATVIY